MLVGPCCVSTVAVNDPENCVGANKVPRIYGSAISKRIARQSVWIDGVDATVAKLGRDTIDAIQKLLISVDAFFVFGCGAVYLIRRTCSAEKPVTGFYLGWGEDAIISNIVEGAEGTRRTTSHDCHQAWKGVGRSR